MFGAGIEILDLDGGFEYSKDNNSAFVNLL